MAPRSRTATLEERPTSSSGIGSAKPSAKTGDFDKRKSRDDLYLMLNADKQRYQSFHVPTRGRLQSLGSGSQETFRGSTTNSIGKQGDLGLISIGMALGSPTHIPSAADWQPQLASVMTPDSAPATQSQEDSTPKSKSRMWGLFRSKSKSKRGRANTETGPGQQKSQDAHISPAAGQRAGERHPGTGVGRSGSLAVNAGKHKPIVIRANTEPVMGTTAEAYHPPPPSRNAPPPPQKDQPAKSRYHERRAPAGGFHLPNSRGPLLDIEIPDITMERYSVMFGQVLQKKPLHQHISQLQRLPEQVPKQPSQQPSQQLQPPPQKPSEPPLEILQPRQYVSPQQPQRQTPELSSSSLLTRRQAALSKLKTIDDETILGVDVPVPDLLPPRPLSSPRSHQRKNSPSLHLFPPTPQRSSLNQSYSPRLRSNTSPADLPSPSQITFTQSQQQPRPPAPRADTFPRTFHKNSSSDRLPNAIAPTLRRPPPPTSRFQRPTPPTRSVPVFDSPTSIDEPINELKGPHQPTKKEPAWDMISPPQSNASSHAGTPKKGSLSSITSTEQITVIQPTPTEDPDAEAEAEAEKALREAVEASITRQISVSREQRQLLGSLNAQTRRRNDSATVGFGPITAGKNERIVETKKLTPTVVHADHENGQFRSGHRPRKSEHVVVEGAE